MDRLSDLASGLDDFFLLAACDAAVRAAEESDFAISRGGEKVVSPFGCCGSLNAEEVWWVWVGGREEAAFGGIGQAVRFEDGVCAMEGYGEAAFGARVCEVKFETFDAAPSAA